MNWDIKYEINHAWTVLRHSLCDLFYNIFLVKGDFTVKATDSN